LPRSDHVFAPVFAIGHAIAACLRFAIGTARAVQCESLRQRDEFRGQLARDLTIINAPAICFRGAKPQVTSLLDISQSTSWRTWLIRTLGA
jgi:hypothetical protein